MRVGLDIGSTTIKCVVLNDAGQIVYSTYERHFSHILEKGRALLEKVAAEYLPDGRAYLAISGSAGMGLADSCKVPFVQEVFATRVAANRLAPGTDCIIELGGEDAKILFLTGGMVLRNPAVTEHPAFAEGFFMAPELGVLERIPVRRYADAHSGLWGAAWLGAGLAGLPAGR